MRAILPRGYVYPREIRSPVEKFCPRKRGVHPVESLLHSGWQPQHWLKRYRVGRFLSSIIIPYRESKSSYCDSKKTGNIVLQYPEVWSEICRPGADYYEERYRSRVLMGLNEGQNHWVTLSSKILSLCM
jgi:hypothetical protein